MEGSVQIRSRGAEVAAPSPIEWVAAMWQKSRKQLRAAEPYLGDFHNDFRRRKNFVGVCEPAAQCSVLLPAGSYKIAVKWYTLAAEQGNAVAQKNMGVLYNNGLGVPKDYRTAVKWYRLAAEQGNPHAQMQLGAKYALGQGVPKDYVRADMWYIIAESNGDKHATRDRSIVAKLMTPLQLKKHKTLPVNMSVRNTRIVE